MPRPVLRPGEIGHHVFHPKRDYRGFEEIKFRNYTGLVVPMYSDRTLHANVEAPPKPAVEHMLGLMATINEIPMDERVGSLWGLETAVRYFSGQIGERNQEIAENLVRQMAYIAMQQPAHAA
jgi:hypothetical protein